MLSELMESTQNCSWSASSLKPPGGNAHGEDLACWQCSGDSATLLPWRSLTPSPVSPLCRELPRAQPRAQLPQPCPRLCQQLTPSGCRIWPSSEVWRSARAGECCRGWEERSGHRCSRLWGADVASNSATAPGDFPLSYLLLTWKNTLGGAPSPALQAGRWGGKIPTASLGWWLRGKAPSPCAAPRCPPRRPPWQHAAPGLCFTPRTRAPSGDSPGHTQGLHCWELMLWLQVPRLLFLLVLCSHPAGRNRAARMC